MNEDEVMELMERGRLSTEMGLWAAAYVRGLPDGPGSYDDVDAVDGAKAAVRRFREAYPPMGPPR